MNSYELYEKVLSAVNEDEGTFNAAARNWIESGKEPDFKDDEAKNLYYAAKIACAAWRSNAINGRVSKRRMVDCVRKIAEMKLSNPYDKNEKAEESKEEVTEEAVEKKVEAEEIKKEPEQERIHVLGVVPEQKEEKHFFGKRKNK